MHLNRLVYALAVSSSFIIGTEASIQRQYRQTIGTRKNMSDKDASALRELKETIQEQSAQIASLKAQLRDASKAGARGHVGHGPPVAPDDDDHYLVKPVYSIAASRIGWLSLFLGSLSLTAMIMNGFEHTLSRQIELAYFVPLLAGHGGNTGGQVVGTVLSALSSGAIKGKDAWKVIRKEAVAGFTVGALLGSVVGILSKSMGISNHVSTVVWFTIPVVSTVAATLGSTIPFICVGLGFDPAVIAAPAMTSFVDVIGLISYFLIANHVFILYGLEL